MKKLLSVFLLLITLPSFAGTCYINWSSHLDNVIMPTVIYNVRDCGFNGDHSIFITINNDGSYDEVPGSYVLTFRFDPNNNYNPNKIVH